MDTSINKKRKRTRDDFAKVESLIAIIRSATTSLQKNLGSDADDVVLPQLLWLLFLKLVDDVDYAHEEELGEAYDPVIVAPYRWRDWVAVKNVTLQLRGDDLLAFVNGELFPYLARLSGLRENDMRTIVGTIFLKTRNLISSGYALREIVDKLNGINFNASEPMQTFLTLYENMLKQIRDAAGKNGNFYTPRPLIRFIIRQLQPVLGELLLDPACGTGGFLVETYERLRNVVRSPEQYRQLHDSFKGIEKKSMPYLLGVMNLLLHGIEFPNLVERNTLSTSIRQIQEQDRVDLIATNPTFDEKEEQGILNNFSEGMRSSDSYLLFLQYVMAMLKHSSGRCGIILPDGFLFGADAVSIEVKRRLLTRFHVHTIVRLPAGVFTPYTSIRTNILFFDACEHNAEEVCTRETWYYELPVKSYTKTKPLRDEDFVDCNTWWKSREENEQAWKVPVEYIIANGYNLDIKNPSKEQKTVHYSPEQLLKQIAEKEWRILTIIEEMKQTLGQTEQHQV